MAASAVPATHPDSRDDTAKNGFIPDTPDTVAATPAAPDASAAIPEKVNKNSAHQNGGNHDDTPQITGDPESTVESWQAEAKVLLKGRQDWPELMVEEVLHHKSKKRKNIDDDSGEPVDLTVPASSKTNDKTPSNLPLDLSNSQGSQKNKPYHDETCAKKWKIELLEMRDITKEIVLPPVQLSDGEIAEAVSAGTDVGKLETKDLCKEA